MSEKIPLATFIDTYKNSHGVDGATELLKETMQALNLEDKTEFTADEAVKLCKELQNKSGFVGIVAGILLTRFRKDNQ